MGIYGHSKGVCPNPNNHVNVIYDYTTEDIAQTHIIRISYNFPWGILIAIATNHALPQL